jgi:DNA polymerase elongation subunit (family B)
MKPKLLLLDIETAPHKVYAWGLYDQNIAINQIVEPGYTLCWSAKWLGKREILFESLHISSKLKMIKAIHALMDEANGIIHYNGSRFDIPTLQQEFVQLGLHPPSPALQIDLYQTCKHRFRFASNKLDYVAGELQLGHKVAHKGMELWDKCMKDDPAAWKVMERYNKQDVRLLERVYTKMLPWIKQHPNYGAFDPDKRVCTNCGGFRLRSLGLRFATSRCYRRFQCMDCGTWSREWQAVTADGKTAKSQLVPCG